VPFERGTIAQLSGQRHAGVVEEEIERSDLLGNLSNLRRIRDVQGERRDAAVGVKQRLARTGVHPLRASRQGFLDQRPSETPVGPGHQNCLTFDCHRFHFRLLLGPCSLLLVEGLASTRRRSRKAIWTALSGSRDCMAAKPSRPRTPPPCNYVPLASRSL
jgi:hypothetical protein